MTTPVSSSASTLTPSEVIIQFGYTTEWAFYGKTFKQADGPTLGHAQS